MNEACERAKQQAGGPSALAKAIGGVTSQAVSQWQRVPANRVLDVERVSGVSRHELRPDIYGPVGQEAAE
ncbi:transcriptional regulator [Ciceribacter ferrooxidans]|uniref:CI repressor n=1 Tax=Ciceribacter ferrooxidans TaxID=2509717 RepID=A0A4Q2SW66_9HYPH|nr:Cro/CI family transcriptional regulator [Ciceribacter ferrooxidans]RYC10376.1 hypothetical protein EUU22_18955 [Ciceribacter ferrooxidans]